MAAACGDGDDEEPTAAASSSPAAPSASAQATVKAAGVLPDLAGLGYTLRQTGREPAVPPGADMVQAMYQKGNDAGKAVLLKVYLMASPADASALYGTFAAAFRNPPPDVLGADAKNVDTPAPSVGQQQKSYVTEGVDQHGNRVYTDIAVAGRTVLIAQVIDLQGTDLMPARTEIARQVFRKAGEVR